MEQWRFIPDWPDYAVSSLGRVISYKRTEPRNMTAKLRGGYLSVHLSASTGVPRWVSIHRLVLMAFVGAPPARHVAAHLNGLSTDNRLENLIWATHSENLMHRDAHGTGYKGEGHPQARLTGAKVRAIRAARARGVSVKFLAAKYRISWQTIYQVEYRNTWKHI